MFDPRFQAIDATGKPYSGAQLFFYRGGTTSLIPIYKNSDATTPHANPVVANTSGAFPAIFIAGANPFKIILKSAAGITLDTIDRIPVGDVIDLETLGQIVGQASDQADRSEQEADRAADYAAIAASASGRLSFKTVAALLADSTLGYSGAGVVVTPGDIVEAQGFRYAVAASGATDSHLQTAAGVKLYYRPGEIASPLAAGATGDGTTDDTAAWQAVVDACPGVWIDGGGKLYLIDRIFLQSHQRIRNARFFKAASTEDLNAAITIDGRVNSVSNPQAAKTDIILTDIEVDGNRINQTNILNPVEDGGRHGIGIYGRVSDVLLERIHAHHCATDGICFYSDSGVPLTYADRHDDDFCFTNIVLRDCKLNWNGRCGVPIDSINGFYMTGGETNDNGRDIHTGDPLDLTSGRQSSYGSRARRMPTDGDKFGRGIFLEDYRLGRCIANVFMHGIEMHRNAQGFLLHSAITLADSASPNYRPRRNYHISDIDVDVPLNAIEKGSITNYPALSLSALNADGTFWPIQNVQISGRFQGAVFVHGVDRFRLRGSVTPHATSAVRFVIRKSKRYDFDLDNWRPGDINVLDAGDRDYRPSITSSTNAGAPSASFFDIDMRAPKLIRTEIAATPAAAGTAVVVLSAPTQYAIEVVGISAYTTATGAPLAARSVAPAANDPASVSLAVGGVSASAAITIVATLMLRSTYVIG